MPYTLEQVDYNPFQADEAAASAPPVDYSQNGGLVAYGQNLKNQLSGYLENSWRGLQRIPGDVADYADTVGNTVAKPYLQGLNELYSTDWSKQPFVGVGEHGELTGRLPALAQVTVPFLAGGAPGGSLGAGMKIPGGYEGGYHGTPHTFPPEPGHPLGRFSDAAIGSGEGAQTYGYGHYVAGIINVGKGYQRTGATDYPLMDVGGKTIRYNDSLSSAESQAFKILNNGLGEGKSGKDILKEFSEGQYDSRWEDNPKSLFPNYPTKQEVGNVLEDWASKDPKLTEGNLYHVEIKPKEEELLSWDKPLSEQPEKVQKALEKFTSVLPDRGEGWTGEVFYKNLARSLWDKTFEGIGGGSKAASQALHEAGIPGIKYLDQGSREPSNKWVVEDSSGRINLMTDSEEAARQHMKGASPHWKLYAPGEYGTHNYVIFHPDNLRVVGKNGETIENHLQNVE